MHDRLLSNKRFKIFHKNTTDMLNYITDRFLKIQSEEEAHDLPTTGRPMRAATRTITLQTKARARARQARPS